jgi:phosphomannomutase
LPVNKPIVSGSGIRGIFGESFTVDTAMNFSAAFGELAGPGRIALGRDTRRSGPAVEAAVAAGLMATGCTPVMLGVVPTPTVQLEAMREGFVGGIAVTASHNPGDWNALKLIGPDGVFLRSDARERLMKILDTERKWMDYRSVYPTETVGDAIERHVARIAGLPGVRREGRKLTAVLDTAGGAATGFAPMLMDALSVDWILINSMMTPDGDFPRIAEPTSTSLDDLADAVTREGADLGFGFDPDGDRIALVAENGSVLGEEFTLALALDFVLPSRPGPVVINLSTSMLSVDAAARHGCPVYRSPVGEVNVVEEMEARGASIGGEGNGGVIDAVCHPGRDAGVGAAYAISFLREQDDMTLSSWAFSFPAYHRVKYKFGLSQPFGNYIERLVEVFGIPDDTRDGLWFGREDGWIHIRASGTEPVVRFLSENLAEETVTQDLESFRKAVSLQCVE